MSANGEGHKYIIIGGGTAGCVLANRLTADKVGCPLAPIHRIVLGVFQSAISILRISAVLYPEESTRIMDTYVVRNATIRHVSICSY